MEEERVPVVAIVGVAGIGKTTLAQLVYNDDEVRKYFSMRSWVYLSEGMDVLEITKKIHESITMSKCDLTDLDLLQLRIKAILQCKRFLIVLDNFCNDQFLEWDILRRPFSDGVRGSRMIVTSRQSTVASTLCASLIHSPSYLSDQDCSMLFKNYAFTSGAASPVLEQLGEEIARKCHGLPILAKVLGRRLKFEADVAEWDLVSSSNIWDLTCVSAGLPRLGHGSLAPHLKRCLAYCSVFPRGCEIEKWHLTSLWMAEGLIPQPKGTETIGNVGNKYIRELVSMSYLQAGSSESCFIMPDIVYELAKHLAGEFSRSQVEVDSKGKLNVNVSEKVRHFSYIQAGFICSEQFEAFDSEMLSQLRTFLHFKTAGRYSLPMVDICRVVNKKLLKLNRLRVLSLARYPLSTLDSVVCLHHLRYLDLSSTSIKQLPRSIGSLYNLETLLLVGCRFLTELPPEVCHLVNLHHLDINGTKLSEMPDGLGKLEALEILTDFFVGRDSGSNIRELGTLPKLHGSLSISNLQFVTEGRHTAAADLKNKKHLVSLTFKWTAVNRGTRSAMETEEVVLLTLEPHKYLKMLTIDNFGGLSFPYWLRDSSLCNLVHLDLNDCKNCTSLPSLGQLPSLSELSLTNFTALKMVGPEFYGSEVKAFVSLTILKFQNMQKWEKWLPSEVGCGEFPSLVQLQLDKCPVLLDEELPLFLNSSLRVDVSDCPKLQNLPARVPTSNQ